MKFGKGKISRGKIGKPELISGFNKNGLKPVEQKKIQFPLRIKVRAKVKRYWSIAKKSLYLISRNPKETFTLISVFMKIKGGQTSTKVGVSFLITVLGLFGVNVNPEMFHSNVQSLIEGAMLVAGAATSLYAIFKDEEENDKELD